VDVEKVVRQVGLGVLRQYKVRFEHFFYFPALIPGCVSGALLYLQSDPISEDELTTKWSTAVGDTFVSNISLPPRTVSIFLLERVNILLPLRGNSNRPCHAVR